MKATAVAMRISNRLCAALALSLFAIAPIVVAQTSNVQLWKSATSGITYKITTSAHHLEAEKIFPPAFEPQVDAGAYVRCEYSEKDGGWTGNCRSNLPLADSRNRTKWCKFKFSSNITSLTPTRIEGESEVWTNEDVDVSKCEVKKSHMQHFVWLPKN
ncbi:MAG: hypothetical protein WBG02_15005 [Candidatus Acidiferrum sp.]